MLAEQGQRHGLGYVDGGEKREPDAESTEDAELVDRQADAALPAGLAEELGRILGEALVLQYQQDTATMDGSPSGFTHPAGAPATRRR
jgi:hypothetical protein